LGSISQPSSWFAQRGFERFDSRPGQVQRQLAAVQAGDLAPIELGQQLPVVRGGQIKSISG